MRDLTDEEFTELLHELWILPTEDCMGCLGEHITDWEFGEILQHTLQFLRNRNAL